MVFHAAALKHVNMLEQYPSEGWKTNVLGTRNVLSAASAGGGVTHFINMSTDKAADPVNVLGHTKRMAEQLTATYAQRNQGRYLPCVFGNVLGSRGSVLETFAAQIAPGGPVTVTHPDVTRYFMTIPEAFQLVVQAGAIGKAGEALVLDMGDPVRIADVAAHLINLEDRRWRSGSPACAPVRSCTRSSSAPRSGGDRTEHAMISHVGVTRWPATSSRRAAWDARSVRGETGSPSQRAAQQCAGPPLCPPPTSGSWRSSGSSRPSGPAGWPPGPMVDAFEQARPSGAASRTRSR